MSALGPFRLRFVIIFRSAARRRRPRPRKPSFDAEDDSTLSYPWQNSPRPAIVVLITFSYASPTNGASPNSSATRAVLVLVFSGAPHSRATAEDDQTFSYPWHNPPALVGLGGVRVDLLALTDA